MEVRSEAFTTTTCPHCGERDETERAGDLFRCRCGFEGHADTGASRTFLTNETGGGESEERGNQPVGRRPTWCSVGVAVSRLLPVACSRWLAVRPCQCQFVSLSSLGVSPGSRRRVLVAVAVTQHEGQRVGDEQSGDEGTVLRRESASHDGQVDERQPDSEVEARRAHG